MANITENRINTTISPAGITAIENAFAQINIALEGVTQTLTEAERAPGHLYGVDMANNAFAKNALAQGTLLLPKLPADLQTGISNLQTDTDLFAQLDKIENTFLKPLQQIIDDTKRLAAHERYKMALAIYRMIEIMAGIGVEGFQAGYDVLKPRFQGQGRKQAPENPL